MKNMIGYCGLDCEKCDAYLATINDDQALREKTAKLWVELNNAPILPEHINCEGCRANGAKTVFCEHMSIGAYYICAAIVTHTQDYNFILEPLYVCKNVCSIYAAAIPMATVYLAVSTLIQSPIFSVGIGLASIVPSVLMINTKIWFAYPMSYPFYLIMVAYGRAAEGVYETQIAWLPWLPVAVGITILALVVSCMRYGASERR